MIVRPSYTRPDHQILIRAISSDQFTISGTYSAPFESPPILSPGKTSGPGPNRSPYRGDLAYRVDKRRIWGDKVDIWREDGI